MKRLKLFYFFISRSNFVKIDKAARRKQGNALGNFIIFLECRVAVISYRLHFVENVFEVRRFLYLENLMVNKKIISLPNISIKIFDIIQLTDKALEISVKHSLLQKIRNGFVYAGIPRYMQMSFSLMFSYIYRYPRLNDLSFPSNSLDYRKVIGKFKYNEPHIGLDIYRVCDHLVR